MRNILITVMLLIVVVLMFQNVIADETSGTRVRIEEQGKKANDSIKYLTP